jgi:hypothetical protein
MRHTGPHEYRLPDWAPRSEALPATDTQRQIHGVCRRQAKTNGAVRPPTHTCAAVARHPLRTRRSTSRPHAPPRERSSRQARIAVKHPRFHAHLVTCDRCAFRRMASVVLGLGHDTPSDAACKPPPWRRARCVAAGTGRPATAASAPLVKPRPRDFQPLTHPLNRVGRFSCQAHPTTQHLFADTDLGRHLRGPPNQSRSQAGSLLPEVRGVLSMLVRHTDNLPAGPESGVHHQGSTPPGRHRFHQGNGCSG